MSAMAAPHTPLLVLDNLQTHFRTEDGVVKAVDGVSLSVQPGEVIGIVGESGSGKSVLSLSVMQLVSEPGRHAGGSITFDGRNLFNLSKREMAALRGNRLAMIFQDPTTCLNPFLTVERQLTEVLERHKHMTRKEARKHSIAMLERVGIPDAPRRIDQYPHQFSGGMRQRVMIAMALLCEPALLIADEPTTALDVTIQAQILDLLRDLQRDFNTAVLLITHDLGVVAGMADRIVVMYAGRVVEEAPAVTLFDTPGHPYTRGLINALPRLTGPRGALTPIPGLPPDLSRLPPGCPFNPRCSSTDETQCKTVRPALEAVGPAHCTACWHPLTAPRKPQ